MVRKSQPARPRPPIVRGPLEPSPDPDRVRISVNVECDLDGRAVPVAPVMVSMAATLMVPLDPEEAEKLADALREAAAVVRAARPKKRKGGERP